MRQIPMRALVLIALAAPLGGCSSFLGVNLARHAPRAAPVQPAEPVVAAAPVAAPASESATALGRRQLAEGQTGLAIESFRKALAAGEPVAPAVNGLGVAYARIGRLDLAQRYFEQAAASDPAEAKYADNLVRVMRSQALAMRSELERTAAAAPSPITVYPARNSMASSSPASNSTAGKLQRVSRGEVRIASAPAQAAPLDGRFKPLVRFALSSPRGSQPHRQLQAPIRIVLPELRPADAGTIAAAAKGEGSAAGKAAGEAR